MRVVAMAEKAVDMAERQMTHRIDMESTMIRGHNKRANVGLWQAYTLALLVLSGAMFLIYKGHDEAGTVIASIDLIGLCGIFIYGRHDQHRRENQRTSSK